MLHGYIFPSLFLYCCLSVKSKLRDNYPFALHLKTLHLLLWCFIPIFFFLCHFTLDLKAPEKFQSFHCVVVFYRTHTSL